MVPKAESSTYVPSLDQHFIQVDVIVRLAFWAPRLMTEFNELMGRHRTKFDEIYIIAGKNKIPSIILFRWREQHKTVLVLLISVVWTCVTNPCYIQEGHLIWNLNIISVRFRKTTQNRYHNFDSILLRIVYKQMNRPYHILF